METYALKHLERNNMASIILKKGREDSLKRRHPWIFSGAIAEIKGSPQSGETVDIISADNILFAKGAYSPHSQISVRIWTFNPEEEINEDFLRNKIQRAIESRKLIYNNKEMSACRLVYAESDSLPGLIVDRFGDYIVCQFLSAGPERWKKEIVEILNKVMHPEGIYERSDTSARLKENLPEISSLISGEMPPKDIQINDGRYEFSINIREGHKTGFYLDQRHNREITGRYLNDLEVLDCFSYSGGFTIAAIKGGASKVTMVDSSADAIALAKLNIELNNLDISKVEPIEDNVFNLLRKFRDSRRNFDAIILDPPKFAESEKNINSAGRAYKDINLLAIKLLRTGGILSTFSCSHHMTSELFRRTVAYAAMDAGRDVQIIQQLHQAPDHPISLNFPEGEYLKGLICRVL
jgi:23S rRNA (cytosine1962-C5)-methyltransferase